MNFTFKDESTDTAILNGTIPASTFEYYLGSGSVTKTYIFSNNTANSKYAFCATPADRSLSVDLSLQYEDQEGDYVQRIFDPGITSYSNATTNTTLYLLSTADGIYVTFQVINAAEQPLEGVIVTGTRLIGGVTNTVAYGTTGADGGVTFWLNPNFAHTFLFELSGYADYTTILTPTQSGYTITMGGTGDTTPNDDYTSGIGFTTRPNNQTLYNNTAYDFKLILTSEYWDIDEFGFVLTNSTGATVGSKSATTNGGTVTLNYNVGNNSAIYMNYYWVSNSNYTNGTVYWYVMNSAGTDWSLKYFFDDLSNYTGQSMFGLDDFGLKLILFIFIFVFTGIMSYKFGLVSPAAISALTFSLVLFLDVGLNLIPNPIGVTHFPTILIGAIMISMIFREVYR